MSSYIPWTDEEIKILLEKYTTNGQDIPELLENHSKFAIMQKANRLGLNSSKVGKRWSEYDTAILVEKYATHGTRIPELSHYTESQIRCKAFTMGLVFNETKSSHSRSGYNVVWNNVTYSNISLACKSLGIKKSELLRYERQGFTRIEAFYAIMQGEPCPTKRDIIIFGKSYPTLVEACRQLDVSYGVVRKAVHEGKNAEEVITELQNKGLLVFGEKFTTLSDALKFYNITKDAFLKYKRFHKLEGTNAECLELYLKTRVEDGRLISLNSSAVAVVSAFKSESSNKLYVFCACPVCGSAMLLSGNECLSFTHGSLCEKNKIPAFVTVPYNFKYAYEKALGKQFKHALLNP